VTEGGTVTMTTAPAATEELLIERSVTYTQDVALPVESNMPEEAIERALDKCMMAVQQIYNQSAGSAEDSAAAAATSAAAAAVSAAAALVSQLAAEAAAVTAVGLPVGGVIIWGNASTIPTGYHLCDGTAVSRTTYADAFAVWDVSCGVGDGSTTWNLPNIKGKVPCGYDATNANFNAVGKTGGAETHALVTAELAAHTHTGTTASNGAHTHNIDSSTGDAVSDLNNTRGGTGKTTVTTSAGAHTHTFTSASSGSGTAHNNIQPYITVPYIIRLV
jgi:microcystin-dependent protein